MSLLSVNFLILIYTLNLLNILIFNLLHGLGGNVILLFINLLE